MRRYATFVEGLAGEDPTDYRAATAHLPPIDSVNHWPYLSGQSNSPPRNSIALGSCSAAPDRDAFCQTEGHQQTIVNAVVAYVGLGENRTLWKLLIGRVPLAGWTWAKYPNGTHANTPTISCGIPGLNGSGCLYNLDEDPYERTNLATLSEFDAIKEQLFAMIKQHNSTTFSPNRGDIDPRACEAARGSYDGFWGPWIQ